MSIFQFMNRVQFIIIVSILFTLLACNQNRAKHIFDSYKFEKIGEKVIRLDTQSVFYYNSYQFLDAEYASKLGFGNKRIFAFFNTSGSTSILLFDYDSSKKIKDIPINIDGPNGIGKIQYLESGFQIIGQDSLVLFNSISKNIYLLNFDGNIVSKIPIKKQTYPAVSLNKPMLYQDGKVYLNNNGGESILSSTDKHTVFPRDLFMSTNLMDKTEEYFGSFSNEYLDTKLSVRCYEVYNTFNPSTKELIISFPISDSITIFNVENKTYKSFYAGNSNFKHFDELENRIGNSGSDFELNDRHFFTQGTFNQICYDPIRKQYLRFFRRAIPEDQYLRMQKSIGSKEKVPHMLVTILDEKFNIIGEAEFDATINGDAIYFTEEGINIWRKKVDSDDYLIFDIFKLNRNVSN